MEKVHVKCCWTEKLDFGVEIGDLLDKRVQTDMVSQRHSTELIINYSFKKLRNFGVDGNLLEWFRSYLKDRRQRVVVHGKALQELSFLFGVPQGSILGHYCSLSM